jgi:hypothetical protein
MRSQFGGEMKRRLKGKYDNFSVLILGGEKMSDQIRPRAAARLNSKLNQNLNAYIAVAGAAGVGMLALTQAAEAKVVYTPANTVVTDGTTIDLNNDNIPDFNFVFFNAYHNDILAVAPSVKGNAIRTCGLDACVGFLGVPVGPGGKFASNNSYFRHGVMMAAFFGYSHTSFGGPWANATNRYLGFQFRIDGQIHYGWARMSVTDDLRSVLLTGYAYETVPNKPILEGHTSGPEKAENLAPTELLAPASQPASLGMLARGADGLAIWRRDEEISG